MPRLNLKTLHTLHQLVSERREGPLTVKVKSFCNPSQEWMYSHSRLSEYRVYIASLLSQLPDGFLQSVSQQGLPWFSAIRLCNGIQWGYMDDADKLLSIGRAASMIRAHTPMVQCDAPFCVILDTDIRAAEHQLPADKRNQSLLYWKFNVTI